jgi:hypothetical protein
MVVKDEIIPHYDAYPFELAPIIRTFVVGLVTGAVGWLLYLAIAHFFVSPVFCRTAETFSVCQNGGTIAWITAHVLVVTAMVAVLARMAVYRPLLVALGVLLSVWGAYAWLGQLQWYQATAWQALLFGLAAVVFGWIARITSFPIALVLSVLLVIAARVVLQLA